MNIMTTKNVRNYDYLKVLGLLGIGAAGNLYVADIANDRIWKISFQ
jgi:hypothetical protein